MFPNQRSNTAEKTLFLAASFVAFALFLFCVLFFTVEAPVADDPQVVMGFTAKYFLAENWLDKFYFLAAQNAEHRMLTTRLYGLFSIAGFGFLSIQFLLVIGVLVLYGIAWCLYVDMKKKDVSRPEDILVFSLILLSPAYWASASSGWGTSNFGSILFPFIALLCFGRKNWLGFLGFEVFMMLSIFTQTNGWFVAPLGVLMLCVERRDHWKSMLAFHILLSVLLFEIYFSRYDSSAELRQMAMAQAMQNPWVSLLNYGRWVIQWVGQWIIPLSGFEHKWLALARWTSLLTGLLMLLVGAFFVVKHFKTIIINFPNQFWLLVLVFASIAIGSMGRSLLLPDKFALSDRYTFYSLCAVLFMYSLFISVKRFNLERLNKEEAVTGRYVFVGVALLYCAVNYLFSYEDLQRHRDKHLMCVSLWQEQGMAKPCLWHGDNGADMKLAEEVGIMRINPGVFAN